MGEKEAARAKLHIAGTFCHVQPWPSRSLLAAIACTKLLKLLTGCGAAAADMARATIIGRKMLGPSSREHDWSQELWCDQRSGSHGPGKRLLVSIRKKEQGTGVQLLSELLSPSPLEHDSPSHLRGKTTPPFNYGNSNIKDIGVHAGSECTQSSGFPRVQSQRAEHQPGSSTSSAVAKRLPVLGCSISSRYIQCGNTDDSHLLGLSQPQQPWQKRHQLGLLDKSCHESLPTSNP